jgi:hypothetical protein
MFGHFLNNIRQLKIKSAISGRNEIISKRAKEHFKLALRFLDCAHKGINMNIMLFRPPTKIYTNNANKHGLWGFSTYGRAWAWTIPEKLQGRAHINLLEFIAQLISIWIGIIEKNVKPFECLLGMGDNTASMGWLCDQISAKTTNTTWNGLQSRKWHAKWRHWC